MIITALFFNDLLRTLVLSLLSVLLTYGTRNSDIKKRITVSCVYLTCVAAGFTWIFFLLIFDNDPDAVPIVLVWGLKWICFFLIIMVIMVQEPQMEYMPGKGAVYFYMNEEPPYCFMGTNEYLPFFRPMNLCHADLNVHGVGEACFILVWDEQGNGSVADWWVE